MHHLFVGVLAIEVLAALRMPQESASLLFHLVALSTTDRETILEEALKLAPSPDAYCVPLRSFIRRIGVGDALSSINSFCEHPGGEITAEITAALSCIFLTPVRLSQVVRFSPSNATDEIEGDIPSSDCQFELDSLESGVFTNFFVWSVVTETSDLSLFRLLL